MGLPRAEEDYQGQEETCEVSGVGFCWTGTVPELFVKNLVKGQYNCVEYGKG